MASITIQQGTKPNAYNGPDGTFPATLTEFGDVISTDAAGDELISSVDGQPYSYREWTWAIEDAPGDSNLVWGRTSEKSGPKSNSFQWLTALFGDKEPPVGLTLNNTQLEGRMALITIKRNDAGFRKITQVTAIPKSMLAGKAAQGTAASVPTSDSSDIDIPF